MGTGRTCVDSGVVVETRVSLDPRPLDVFESGRGRSLWSTKTESGDTGRDRVTRVDLGTLITVSDLH